METVWKMGNVISLGTCYYRFKLKLWEEMSWFFEQVENEKLRMTRKKPQETF